MMRWFYFELTLIDGKKVYHRVQSVSHMGALRGVTSRYPKLESYRSINESCYRAAKNVPQEGFQRRDPQREKEYGKILGLEGRISFQEIKRKYRDALSQYHPDRVHGLGEELQQLAAEKTKKIKEAYEYFQQHYSSQSPSK